MTAQEICKEIADKIGPQLEELGVDAFVLVGYVQTGDDGIKKIQIENDGKNPAYADGLRLMKMAALGWGGGSITESQS